MVPDRDLANPVFQDDEIAVFLELEADSPKKAAALAIETIAVDEALVQKVMTNQGLSTNGAATATALLNRAKMLRQQAQADADSEEDAEGLFDIAEQVVDQFSARERIAKQAQRYGY